MSYSTVQTVSRSTHLRLVVPTYDWQYERGLIARALTRANQRTVIERREYTPGPQAGLLTCSHRALLLQQQLVETGVCKGRSTRFCKGRSTRCSC